MAVYAASSASAPVSPRLPSIGLAQERRTAILMVKRVWSRTLIRRGRVLEHARELARTGKYPDHLSILTEVRRLPDSPMVEERWFHDPGAREHESRRGPLRKVALGRISA